MAVTVDCPRGKEITLQLHGATAVPLPETINPWHSVVMRKLCVCVCVLNYLLCSFFFKHLVLFLRYIVIFLDPENAYLDTNNMILSGLEDEIYM